MAGGRVHQSEHLGPTGGLKISVRCFNNVFCRCAGKAFSYYALAQCTCLKRRNRRSSVGPVTTNHIQAWNSNILSAITLWKNWQIYLKDSVSPLPQWSLKSSPFSNVHVHERQKQVVSEFLNAEWAQTLEQGEREQSCSGMVQGNCV